MDIYWYIIILFILVLSLFTGILVYNKKQNKRVKVDNTCRLYLKGSNNKKPSTDQLKKRYKQLRKCDYTKIENIAFIKKSEGVYGIYAIYINKKNITETIPVYVGQSNNINRRWKEHYENIRETHSGYRKNQTYKMMDRYLKDNHLKMRDYRFVILEETSEKNLDRIEKDYITYFDSYEHGFNRTAGNNEKPKHKKNKNNKK